MAACGAPAGSAFAASSWAGADKAERDSTMKRAGTGERRVCIVNKEMFTRPKNCLRCQSRLTRQRPTNQPINIRTAAVTNLTQ